MQKEPIVIPMEPFTSEEEAALYEKLDVLSVAQLESYIGSAQNSLNNRGLDPSWRPRVQMGLQRAEIVLVREAAAAVIAAAAAKAEAAIAEAPKAEKPEKADKPEKAEKPKKTTKADKAEKVEKVEKTEASEEAEDD